MLIAMMMMGTTKAQREQLIFMLLLLAILREFAEMAGAIFHMHANVHTRSRGHSAVAAAAYRAGEKLADHHTRQIHNFTRKEGVKRAVIIPPKGAPSWATNREELWNRLERAEPAKNSQLCRDIEVAVPTLLTRQQQAELVVRFVTEELTPHGLVADVAFHDKGDGNPHAHILTPLRPLTAEGFGQKQGLRFMNTTEQLERWRERWAHHTNQALEKAGHDVRVDHRSLEAQGIDREPQKHRGARHHIEQRQQGPQEAPQRHRIDWGSSNTNQTTNRPKGPTMRS